MQSEYIWLDGELVPFERATVHFLNPTLHYGPGVFEGIRCYATARGPAVFRLREHLERFLASARVLGVTDLPYGLDELRDAICRTVCANGFSECYIRPLMYFDGPLGLNLDAYRPVVAIAAWKWGAYLGQEGLETGVRMMVSSMTRMHPNSSMTKAKISGQYVNSILAKTMAARAGFDEAVMLDPDGYVAECTGENLLLVRDRIIYTTPRAAILEGITRDTVITLARDAGYTVVEERLSRDQLYIADEVFVCGTAAEVAPVREIDYRAIGNGRVGPVTHHLQQLFYSAVRGEHHRSAEWLDYMVMEPMI
ncbi:MAG: branched-chain amino acid transaminase [Chloroflexi bacterium]|nr:branched-chain amino acid transaminase [Chloroflexota bacterium]MCI0576781.1 branched-chain amino acid transaminase [Chloroflexota bacterium]MCI0645343.1 branched-chain amino acid transaminase [Chloroflexota bacterium]MCI0725109.1 branched-chain amino acid transaminase [Chloroflexota bacterium]